MPPDETQPQTPPPEENPSPTSPQEHTEPASENTSISEHPEASPEPQEAQGDDFESKVESKQLPENQENQQNRAENTPTPQTEETLGTEPSTSTTSK